MQTVKKYGYVRVSSKDQNETRQIIAMKENGIMDNNIFVDKISGKNFDRPEYNRLINELKSGDVLFIKSIDRLGRNYTEIIEQWRHLTKEINIDIVVLDMPLLDTRIGKDLIGTFLSDIILEILSFVAENERKNIKERQKEGIAAAKINGVKFGRPVSPLPENFYNMVNKWNAGQITGTEAARILNMPVSTFYKKANIANHSLNQ